MSTTEGSGSHKSDDSSSSLAAPNDYEIVNEASKVESNPHLNIVGNGDESDLQEKLRECMEPAECLNMMEIEPTDDDDNETLNSLPDISPAVLVNENVEDHTIFHNLSFLGTRSMKEPKNEQLIHAYMKEMNVLDDLLDNESARTSKDVNLSVPRTSDGWVFLCDLQGRTISKFPIYRIIFFARGNASSTQSACFAFTCAVLEEKENAESPVSRATYECHVFKCQVPEAVTKVFVSFAQAFKKPASGPEISDSEEDEKFVFEVSLEIKENTRSGSDSGKDTSYEMVPRQKGIFKLRSNVEKKVVVSVQQVSRNSCRLGVERCFGMLVSPGRNVRHADMQLLEHISMATLSNQSDNAESAYETNVVHVISGIWDPRETSLAVLNKETPPEVSSVFLTIAADLVMTQVAEPVRFVIETKARISPQNERYWYYTKKSLIKQYQIRLRRRQKRPDGADPAKLFDVIDITQSEEIDQRSKMTLSLNLANLTASTWGVIRSPPTAGGPLSSDLPNLSCDDDESDNEEPVLSGFGFVSKDCSTSVLDSWSQVLTEWDRENPLNYPKQLPGLVRDGIPEALRGEVWQRLTGASMQQEEVNDMYRILITKESPDEKVILRDIHRTFPAHEHFKEAGGVGQESLYRISKAYSVYDSEIGYCQGQSFLIAALLLQMPEEQAFGVLVRVMHNLGLRDMFRESFEQLQLRLYQLDRLIETQLPDLWQHFVEHGVESHMYASQWFLTLFTAKFPLFLVFRVLDVFLLQGIETIFLVALAILKVARKDLLNQDFEGLMKYFRVNIPKTYRSEENAKHLMTVACSVKLKKLKKYEKEWIALKDAERAREDPVQRLERENKKLVSEQMRLEMENESLARELVTSKIEMRKDYDKLEDEKDHLEKELDGTKALLVETLDEKKRLEVETEQLKALLKREIAQFDAELATKNNVISEYKIICSQLSEKLEQTQQKLKDLDKHGPNEISPRPKEEVEIQDQCELSVANQRVRELELELAQTKLALVETECKNQDLLHQLGTVLQEQHTNSSSAKNTWFSKTLSSIRESAVTAASGGMVRSASSMSTNNSADNSMSPILGESHRHQVLSKSSSVEAFKKDAKGEM